jgi:hypothetical protein
MVSPRNLLSAGNQGKAITHCSLTSWPTASSPAHIPPAWSWRMRNSYGADEEQLDPQLREHKPDQAPRQNIAEGAAIECLLVRVHHGDVPQRSRSRSRGHGEARPCRRVVIARRSASCTARLSSVGSPPVLSYGAGEVGPVANFTLLIRWPNSDGCLSGDDHRGMVQPDGLAAFDELPLLTPDRGSSRSCCLDTNCETDTRCPPCTPVR